MYYMVNQHKQTHGGSGMEDFYTAKEIAETLKVSEQIVYRWCRDGILRHHKVPSSKGNTGTIRIPQSAFDEFLEWTNMLEKRCVDSGNDGKQLDNEFSQYQEHLFKE